ncbi:hypothetical protein [Mucilaginibacter sp.]|uniref:hypothetical protein n=1 Tax=Mucilaginibacter sp. TaxID=1882438 RepID=UPI003B0087D4
MKMSALKAMMMAGAMIVATCLTANASPVKHATQMSQDTMKKGKKMGKMGKMKKMKKDTSSKM